MKKTDKIFFYLLLLIPFISSILSTIHIIDLVSLGNKFAMAISIAITFEISSVISFALTGETILKNVNKGALYFIFSMLFILQAIGNIYSGFSYMTDQLVINSKYLDTFMEMSFNYFNLSETKLLLSSLIGLPLPIISLVMLKFAIDKASVVAFTNTIVPLESIPDDNIEIPEIENVETPQIDIDGEKKN